MKKKECPSRVVKTMVCRAQVVACCAQDVVCRAQVVVCCESSRGVSCTTCGVL